MRPSGELCVWLVLQCDAAAAVGRLPTGLVLEERLPEPTTPDQPNRPTSPTQLADVWDRCRQLGLVDRCARVPARPATDEQLLTCHSAEHVEMWRQRDQAAFCRAALAAGSAIELTDQILEGKLQNGFVMVGPTEPDPAADRAFYEDDRVLVFSTHRLEGAGSPRQPADGDFDAAGAGQGAGFTWNVPLDGAAGDAELLAVWHRLLLPAAYEFAPDLVVVSAGFGAALGNPKVGMRVTPACFGHLTHALLALAAGRLETTILDVMCAHHSVFRCFSHLETFSAADAAAAAEMPDCHWPSAGRLPDAALPAGLGTGSEAEPEAGAQDHGELLNRLLLAPPTPTPAHRVYLATDRQMLRHRNTSDPQHPERPERLTAVMSRLADWGLDGRCHRPAEPRRVSEDQLLAVHEPAHLAAMADTAGQPADELDRQAERYDSVYLAPDSYDCALLAAGCVVEAVDSVLSGEGGAAACVVRPPGHHAEPHTPHGFCLFNNVAVAARHACRAHGLSRVLVVDWDVHHGNGIQHMFYEDRDVLYLSLHRHDHGFFFPMSDDGDHDRVGEGAGRGFNVNVPWNRARMAGAEYLAAFLAVVLPVAYQFAPELVFVSAGFDAARGDPLGGYGVAPEVYGHLTHHLAALAGGRLVVALEGGYNLTSVAYSMAMCVRALLGDPLDAVRRLVRERHAAAAGPAEPSSQTELDGQTEGLSHTERAAAGSEEPGDTGGEEPEAAGGEELGATGGSAPGEELVAGATAAAAAAAAESATIAECLLLQQELDGMYAVIPLPGCPHLSTVCELPAAGIDASEPCCECGDLQENWVCLTCYQVCCGRYRACHMLDHGAVSGHCMVLSLADLSVWCYVCEAYVHHERLIAAKRSAHRSKFGVDMPV
ncbi:histone deacetylase 6-like [Pollicipes pollicipes]|uniref:histone deacetylase 6-like n=1 Tax=Pollicipes pollicipes TaxID=41117 RepID=UPI0018850214|nr:histone deacetylase 6-like [Pollicipes pollicipes]